VLFHKLLLAESCEVCKLFADFGNAYLRPMKKIEPWQAILFLGSLLIVAVLVNSGRDYRRIEPVNRASTPPRRTREEIAAEHSNYSARYMSTGVKLKPGMRAVAIAVVSEDSKFNPIVANALSSHLRTKDISMLSSIFTPEFISDGLFAKTFRGSLAVLRTLELTNSLHAVFLGQQTVQFSTNTALGNVISAHMHLELISLSLARNGEIQQYEFSANGAGFKPAEARAQAEERLLNQIAADTNLLIQPILETQ